MKRTLAILATTRILLAAAILFLAPVVASADCLNQYNNDLIVCDQYFCPNGVLTCAGCKADAWVNYYDCILEKATN